MDTTSPSETAADPEEAPPATSISHRPENGGYFELLGGGLALSLNYEHAFDDFAARLGLGYFSVGENGHVTVPFSLSYLGLGSPAHMLELGLGATVTTHHDSLQGDDPVVLGNVIIGYRFQATARPSHVGFMLRVGFTMLYGIDAPHPLFGEPNPLFGESRGAPPESSSFFVPYWPHLSLGGAL